LRRSAAALLLPLLLVLSGCGSNPDLGVSVKTASIADVSVSGAPGQKPLVNFKPPVGFAKTESKIITKGPGKGDAITDASQVKLNFLGVNASDASEFASTYGASTQPAIFTLNQVIAGFGKGLQGAHAGDRVLITVTPADAYGTAGNGADIGKDTSVIFVVDVLKVTNPAKPLKLSKKDIPPLTVDKSGNPTGFKKAPGLPGSIKKLGVAVLKQGTGAAVTSTATLSVNYLGQVYPDGKVFDESYSKGQPASLALANVIPGWQQGLVGQKAGSRVVLEIPSALGYGASGQGTAIPPNSDLIFVIDIVSIGP
jgi:peptidylprolyl isomerase